MIVEKYRTIGAKVSGQKGDSPDWRIRCIKIIIWNDLYISAYREVGLEAAIH